MLLWFSVRAIRNTINAVALKSYLEKKAKPLANRPQNCDRRRKEVQFSAINFRFVRLKQLRLLTSAATCDFLNSASIRADR